MSGKNENNKIQIRFIEQLKNTVPANISLADAMADLLELSTDSAYRRIRGETSLSIDETLKLCNHFKIPFDSLQAQQNTNVSFVYDSFGKDNSDLDPYLNNMLQSLQYIVASKEKHVYFAAEDVPIFHHFEFENLSSFKFFYWKKSILNDVTLEGVKYEKKRISKDTLKIARKIIDLYVQVPSTEVWTEDTIVSTLKQVLFYWEAGLFMNKKDAVLICDEMHEMMNHLQKQAEFSTKFNYDKKQPANHSNNFNLFSSEVMIGNNTVLAEADNFRLTILSFNTIKTLNTTNAVFYDLNDRWMKNLIRKSIPISGVSEKQRYQFFKKVHETIDKIKTKISQS